MAFLAAPLRSALLRTAGRPSVWSPAARAAPALLAPRSVRGISAAASSKIAKALGGELKHEQDQYEQAKEIKSFLKASPFKFIDTEGDVNMALEREMGDKTVRVEWQLSSPFNPDGEEEEGEEDREGEATEVTVTVENKAGAGMSFFCSTQHGEDHRYVIGMVRCYGSQEEKDSASAYNGPEFEDLDDKLQESFDEYLAELGMSGEVCDFVDAMALDKEQREYVRWLSVAKKFVEA
mmetsp:Transcript_139095/g.432758  ORF Transcript_139095/g.432758 Transcript_139095/m.432758 type:complete len:236 (-) Transcript_139095:51-758(-)